MSKKSFFVDDIGEVFIHKRKGARSIRLRVSRAGISVSQPIWMTYMHGLRFIEDNRAWVKSKIDYLPKAIPNSGSAIGKQGTFHIKDGPKLQCKQDISGITLYIPDNIERNNKVVTDCYRKGAIQYLRYESELLLISRLKKMAAEFGFEYSSVRCKNLKARWGSCTGNKDISLSIYLMTLPWELIDYVLLHELTHTVHLNHSQKFWNHVEGIMPDYKLRRKSLKKYHVNIVALN